MKKNFLAVFRSLRQVFTKPLCITVILVVALLLLLATVWLSIRDLIVWVIASDYLSLIDKFKILAASLGTFRTNFTLLSQVISIIVAFLAGINVALLIHYLRRRVRLQRESGMSIVGIVLGMLGVGCSACGSIVLSSLFGLTTASALLSFLPLKGTEFGLLSIVLLLWSIYYTGKKAEDPFWCNIRPEK